MSDASRRGTAVVPAGEYEKEVESVVREELTILARSLAARISWRLAVPLADSRPDEARSRMAAAADAMIGLMGCYGFDVTKGDE